MNKNVSFTVFIPCYGKCQYLSKTLDSLLDQNYPLEIVVCPQGNTDVSFVSENYPMVKIVGLERPSLFKARIYLFDKSDSEYILFVDDDDILPKGLFSYINSVIQKTNMLDLYRIPLKEFKNEEWVESLRDQKFGDNFFFESKEQFQKKCFDGYYHNGVVHLFIKNGLKPRWFDVDVFQTEDKLITFSIVDSVKTNICVINDAFYLYRRYPFSHSRTLDFLKGRDDFITVSECLKEFMTTEQFIYNGYPIIMRIISYLKVLTRDKIFTREKFDLIYSNDKLWDFLEFFLKHKKVYKMIAGKFVCLITKFIYKKRFLLIKILIWLKNKYELRKYGKIEL